MTVFYQQLQFTTKLSPILIVLDRSRDATVVIGGETLSPHSAGPRKMPGWIVPVREKFSVNKRVCRKQTIKNCIKVVLSVFFFQILHLAFTVVI